MGEIGNHGSGTLDGLRKVGKEGGHCVCHLAKELRLVECVLWNGPVIQKGAG